MPDDGLLCARDVDMCLREFVFAFSEFCFCVCVQQGRHIAHKFESGWEVGVIKVFDKKGPHAGKFSVKYKDDPNWWTHTLLREGYGKDKHWVLCFDSSAVIPLEVTYDCSHRRPDFLLA
jgi:hypothetical protein